MDNKTKVVGVIPARYGSSRFPGKVLAQIGDKPMIQHVYERAKQSQYLSQIIVAVDDNRVKQVVEGFGGVAMMTDPALPSGTDRVAAVAKNLDHVEILCNIQADEPFIDPSIIDEAIAPLVSNPKIGFSTVMHSIDHEDGYKDPGVVKTVIDKAGFGLYFSRSQIPYPRTSDNYKAYEHLGVYVYRKDALLRFVQWPVSPLEKTESLEMLRILDNDEIGRASCRERV